MEKVADASVPLWRRWPEGHGVMPVNELEARKQIARNLVMDHERMEQRREQEAVQRRKPSEVVSPGPEITPPPELPACLLDPASLQKRQDNGQIQALSQQIQSISSVASSISQASRQVSQTSQQLAQSASQLAQSTSRLSQSIGDLQNSVQQAQQTAQQAQEAARQASEAASRASQSAESAISSAQSSAASSASQAIAEILASATSSAGALQASLLSDARASANSIMSAASSQVRAAQADATLARADAQSQVNQAQGAAVSVTQAALAVVGTFIGSSLLTIVSFYLVLRLRQNRRRRRSQYPDISYPRKPSTDERYGSRLSFGDNGYPIDRKAPLTSPLPVATRNSGVALIGDPPAAGKKSTNQYLSLFPKTPSTGDAAAGPNGGVGMAQTIGSPSSSRYSGGPGEGQRDSHQNGAASTKAAPSLQQWLNAGTVSPFGTLKKGSNEAARGPSPSWPLDKKTGGPQRGVGGVNAGGGGGGKVMRPGSRLPFRES